MTHLPTTLASIHHPLCRRPKLSLRCFILCHRGKVFFPGFFDFFSFNDSISPFVSSRIFTSYQIRHFSANSAASSSFMCLVPRVFGSSFFFSNLKLPFFPVVSLSNLAVPTTRYVPSVPDLVLSFLGLSLSLELSLRLFAPLHFFVLTVFRDEAVVAPR